MSIKEIILLLAINSFDYLGVKLAAFLDQLIEHFCFIAFVIELFDHIGL